VVSIVNVHCAGGPSAETKTLIVRNLSYDTTEESLKLLFDDALNCRLLTHADSGKSKGLVVFVHRFVCSVTPITGKTRESRGITKWWGKTKKSGELKSVSSFS